MKPTHPPRRPRTSLSLAAIATAGLLATACASTPAPADPTSADASASASAPQGPAWRIFSDPLSGMSVAMPQEPKRAHFVLDGPHPVDTRALSIADGNPATPDYELARLATTEREMAFTLDSYVAAVAESWKRIDRQDKRTRNGVPTVEIEGILLDGPAVMSITCLGGWIYAATVRSASGLDRDAVERFLDSVSVEMPWRIEPVDDQMFTVALPAPAYDVPTSPSEDAETRVYSLGGADDVAFSVTWFPLTDERLATASPDRILDDTITGLTSDGKTRIEKVAPIELHGVPGRDATHSSGDGFTTRSRVLVLGHRAYLLSIISKNPALLTQPLATRFLDSLRIGALP